ncbi:MAG: PA domain-containing protein [Pyrinomonadaceae bacterium]
MRKMILAKFSLALLATVVGFSLSSSAFGAATIVIQNGDAAGVGFNDTTPVAPVGGNPGTTLGQQRLNAFQFAANIWGATLDSSSTITVRATWEPLSCTSTSAVLGAAGAATIWRDFSGAPFSGTWYSAALANALTGVDLQAGSQEITARFNVNLGTTGCGETFPFYLGFDNNHGGGTDLVAVLLHEFSHGLGFQTFTNSSTGAWNAGFPSIYDRFLFDNNTGKTWAQPTMTDAERQASAISGNRLSWNGTNVTTDLQSILGTPLLRVNSPVGIAGNYAVGTAAFGAPLSFPGVTANITQASPNDACSALTNAVAMSGKIALIDRGSCTFVLKVKNAQNAGAIGVIIVNNDAANPTQVVQMGGADATITIASLSVSLNDGTTIKSQLGGGVNATLLTNTAVPSGVDGSGRALLFAPNPFQGGSSVSHWDTTEYPNQLMEPAINGDLTHSVVPVWDLTLSLFQDIGWRGNKIGDSQFFVRQHYSDFLNRLPDSSGLAFWNNQIVECGIDKPCIENRQVNVSAAFFLSIEFQETGYLVYRFYKSAYGNIPAAPVPVRFGEFLPDTQQIGQGVVVGVGNWQAQLEANKQAFALAFVSRSRFANAFAPSLTPAQFVDALFANAGFTPSASERNAAIAEFGGAVNTADNAARSRALRLVAENSQLKNLEFNKAFVLMQYFGYLRRNPNDPPEVGLDFSGYNFWLSKLNQFNGNFVNAEMVKAFIVSGEYRQRFGF